MSGNLIKLLDIENPNALSGVPTLTPTQSVRNLYKLFAVHSGGSANGNAISAFSALCEAVKNKKAWFLKYEHGKNGMLYALVPAERTKAMAVVSLMDEMLDTLQEDDVKAWLAPEGPAVISLRQKPLMQVCSLSGRDLCELSSLNKSISYVPEVGEWQCDSVELMGQLAKDLGQATQMTYADGSVLTVDETGHSTFVPKGP